MNKTDRILVINVGSTSFKYQLLDMGRGCRLAKGRVENVFTENAEFQWECGEYTGRERLDARGGYDPCIQRMLEVLTDSERGAVTALGEIGGVGFKAVLAGRINCPSLVDEELLRTMDRYSFVAPAHNPPYIAAMRAFQSMMPGTPLVASFETSFHQTIPEYAYVYPFPEEYRKKYGLRKYGFHGASHSYVAWKLPQILNRRDLRVISCHLGGSSSLCAIRNGRSLDTSMGFSPQAGLPNNNRNGDLDVFSVLYLMEQEGMSPVQMRELLSKKSGLLGLSGISGDMRVLKSSGAPQAKLAIEHLVYCVKKYIGSFAAVMNGVDVVTFSGGIGENDDSLRSRICDQMDFLGIRLDEEANRSAVGALPEDGVVISPADRSVKVIVLPTNEEWMVAMNTHRVIAGEVEM